MHFDQVQLICKKIGKVISYKEDKAFFGNIDLKLVTSGNKILYIVSDRGEFSCYLIEDCLFFEKQIPISKVIDGVVQEQIFSSFNLMIDYLESNIAVINNY